MEKYFQLETFGPFKGMYYYNMRPYRTIKEVIQAISEPHEIKIFEIAGIRDFPPIHAKENSEKCFALALDLEAINPAEANRALALASQFELADSFWNF